MTESQELEATLSVLLQEMEGEIADRREFHERLVQTLNGMRATGMPLPQDLVDLEAEMSAEFERLAHAADRAITRVKPD